MNFAKTPREIAYEHMMKAYPNYRPQGSGKRKRRTFEYTAENCVCELCIYTAGRKGCKLDHCICIDERIAAGALTPRDVFPELAYVAGNPIFTMRIKNYLKGSEDPDMTFRNEKHRYTFEEATKYLIKSNKALMAAVFLFTAENRLWCMVKRHVERNKIDFDRIKVKGCSEVGYALFYAAKDLYLGTEHMTLTDLADTELFSNKLFGVICNAIAIARYGLGAIQYTERSESK